MRAETWTAPHRRFSRRAKGPSVDSPGQSEERAPRWSNAPNSISSNGAKPNAHLLVQITSNEPFQPPFGSDAPKRDVEDLPDRHRRKILNYWSQARYNRQPEGPCAKKQIRRAIRLPLPLLPDHAHAHVPRFRRRPRHAVSILQRNPWRLRRAPPHHAKAYRNFAEENRRQQAERIAAFREHIADVYKGRFPDRCHLVEMEPRRLMFDRHCGFAQSRMSSLARHLRHCRSSQPVTAKELFMRMVTLLFPTTSFKVRAYAEAQP
jgi:hypothetical protein